MTFAIVPIEVFADDRLTKMQIRVLGAILSFRNRNTGLCFPSRERISERCGYNIRTISRTTTSLVQLGWLTKEGDGGRSKACRYRFHVPEFLTAQVGETVPAPETVPGSETVSGSGTQDSETVPTPGTKTVPTPGTRIEQTIEHTNEDQQTNTVVLAPETFETVEVPDYIDPGLIAAFIQHRREMKKPLTPTAEKLMVNNLERLRKQGHDPNACLQHSIANGYQGVFAPGGKSGGTRETHTDRQLRIIRSAT